MTDPQYPQQPDPNQAPGAPFPQGAYPPGAYPPPGYGYGGSYEPPKGNTPAIWALVFGILSVLLPVVATIPAIIFAIFGIKRANHPEVRGNGRGMAITGLVLGLALPVFSCLPASILYPALRAAKERANRVKCAANFKQIGMAAILYANDNRNQYPATLGDLVATGDLKWDVVVCPSSSTDAEPTPDVLADKKKLADWVNQHTDYVYLGAAMTSNDSADAILAYEKVENHEKEGMIILFNDGHVEWMIMKQANQALQRRSTPAIPKGGG